MARKISDRDKKLLDFSVVESIENMYLFIIIALDFPLSIDVWESHDCVSTGLKENVHFSPYINAVEIHLHWHFLLFFCAFFLLTIRLAGL